MATSKFKEGDMIYYFSKELGTVPCKVTKVFNTGVVGVSMVEPNSKVVSERKCMLQSEWAEREGIMIEIVSSP